MDEIEKMEAALRAAVAAHRRARQLRESEEARGFELRFLLSRLGLTVDVCDAVAGAALAACLQPALRAALGQRLAGEATRLRRLARARSPAYDLNRHIAVRRAEAWITGAPVPVDPAGPALRRSGWVLNRRCRNPAKRLLPGGAAARPGAPGNDADGEPRHSPFG